MMKTTERGSPELLNLLENSPEFVSCRSEFTSCRLEESRAFVAGSLEFVGAPPWVFGPVRPEKKRPPELLAGTDKNRGGFPDLNQPGEEETCWCCCVFAGVH
ncbi:hypothetical protein LIER_24007 [Lithospermum erythrorhizon]|uniref:Uncharacterized protein n=1 Tax=Lithospermum erythrorhizon TaxID=34254 RepID=A0AAV3R2T8_LITER